jgi:predicted component of type VI protein secretion system
LSGPDKVEALLNGWLQKYTTANEGAGPETKAKYPLREARVQVRERAGSPGSYDCVIHLRPHYQLDQMETALKFTTELVPARSGASA